MSCPQTNNAVWKIGLLLVPVVIGIGGCSQPAAPVPPAPPVTVARPRSSAEPHLTELCKLIAQRLGLMPGVAQAKWNRKLPITDEKREQALLAKLAADGESLNLPTEFVTDFFRAQITAAKLVQEEAFQKWTAEQRAPFPNPPDLEKDVRPKIDDINRQMLEELKRCWAERTDPEWATELNRATRAAFESTPWPRDVITAATKPLQEIAVSAP